MGEWPDSAMTVRRQVPVSRIVRRIPSVTSEHRGAKDAFLSHVALYRSGTFLSACHC